MATERPRRNALEWAVFALGALLTAGVVGYLGWAAAQGGGGRPDLRVSVGAAGPAHGQVLVPIRVENAGTGSAEDVRVEVCQRGGCAEIAFPFVPKGSEREGQVGFDRAGGPLAARVVSYLEP